VLFGFHQSIGVMSVVAEDIREPAEKYPFVFLYAVQRLHTMGYR
jgi:hypothetical protein